MRTRTKLAAGLVGGLALLQAVGASPDSLQTDDAAGRTSDAPVAGPAGSPAAAPAGSPAPSRAPSPGGPSSAPPAAATRSPAAPPPPPTRAAAAPLLLAAAHGDGDSWKDTQGREYRLGLVNAPELDECFGRTASSRRKALVADGFRAQVYDTDDFGRSVSVVTLADGRNLNVLLARTGLADDRYLARYRAENPSLAAQLDTAFAAAKRERAGLWGACSGAPDDGQGDAAPAPDQAPAPAASSCHPDYVTCIPVQGDGSGRGQANDLDCGDLRERVVLRGGRDPYRLDSDSDGAGCESYG